MLEIGFFVFLVLLFYGAGRAFMCLIRWQESEFLFSLSSCIGVILITIAVTWYYRLGGRLSSFFWIISIFIGSFLLWRLIRQTKILELITDARVELLALVAFSVLAVLPGILGGEQFVIFRGNQADAFNYLEAAITYQGLSYTQVDHLDAAKLASYGLFQIGHEVLLLRPEIAFLYGMLTSFHVGAFLRLHYFLLVYFQFLTFCTVRALATQLLPGRRIMPFLLAAAVVGGFWGQYILDIDAWSQSSCMPLIALSLLLFIKLAQAAGSIERSPETLKLLILYALAWVGMFYLYPEAAGFVLPAHALCWIIGICLLRIRISWQSIGLTAIAAAGLLLPVTYSNLMFLVFQAKGTALAGVTWWTYFQAFLVGQGGPNGDLFSKGVASPFRMTASARSLLNRTAISAAIVFLFLQLAFFCYRPVASPSASGIHYSTPYPANPANLKKTINFADWSFLRHVKTRGFSASPACSCMHIASDSVWKRLRLIARGIPEMSYQRRPVQKQLFV